MGTQDHSYIFRKDSSAYLPETARVSSSNYVTVGQYLEKTTKNPGLYSINASCREVLVYEFVRRGANYLKNSQRTSSHMITMTGDLYANVIAEATAEKISMSILAKTVAEIAKVILKTSKAKVVIDSMGFFTLYFTIKIGKSFPFDLSALLSVLREPRVVISAAKEGYVLPQGITRSLFRISIDRFLLNEPSRVIRRRGATVLSNPGEGDGLDAYSMFFLALYVVSDFEMLSEKTDLEVSGPISLVRSCRRVALDETTRLQLSTSLRGLSRDEWGYLYPISRLILRQGKPSWENGFMRIMLSILESGK